MFVEPVILWSRSLNTEAEETFIMEPEKVRFEVFEKRMASVLSDFAGVWATQETVDVFGLERLERQILSPEPSVKIADFFF